MKKNSQRNKTRRWAIIGGLSLIVVMLGLAAAWNWTPLQDVAEPRVIARWLRGAAYSPWMPLIVAVVFVGASLIVFPNTVLSLAVIMALGPLMGAVYAFSGSLAASLAGYAMGRWGGKRVEKLHIGAFDKISAELRRGGFVDVLMLRLLPVPPFSVLNMLAGAARVRVLPFLAATAVGIAPYILAFAAFGRQARRLFSDPTPTDLALTVAIIAVATFALWQARSFAVARTRAR